MDCSTPGFPVHHQLLEFTQIHVHWVGDAVQSSYPLSTPFLLPSTFPSIRVFTNESVLQIRWPKYWRFNVSLSPSSEYSGLISFRMDWLDLLLVQGTLKSLLQHQVPNMLLEISGEITPERMKGWSQSKSNTQLWLWLVIEARSNAVKSNIA